jgi:hypothetical protein
LKVCFGVPRGDLLHIFRWNSFSHLRLRLRVRSSPCLICRPRVPTFACHWRCYTASQRRIDFERDGNGIGKEVYDAVHEFFCCLCLFPLQHGIRNFAKKRSDLAPVALYIDSQHRSACTTFHLPFFGVSFWLSSTRRSLTATNRVPIIVAMASRHKLHCALRLEIIKTRVTTHHCCPTLLLSWLY